MFPNSIINRKEVARFEQQFVALKKPRLFLRFGGRIVRQSDWQNHTIVAFIDLLRARNACGFQTDSNFFIIYVERVNLHIYQQSDHGDSLDRNFRRLFLDKNITWSSREDNPTCNITPQWGQIHSHIKVSKSQKQFFLKLHCPKSDLNFWQISALASKMGQIKRKKEKQYVLLWLEGIYY